VDGEAAAVGGRAVAPRLVGVGGVRGAGRQHVDADGRARRDLQPGVAHERQHRGDEAPRAGARVLRRAGRAGRAGKQGVERLLGKELLPVPAVSAGPPLVEVVVLRR